MSEDFKLEVLSDYYSSGQSKGFIARKYGLKSIVQITDWIKRFPIDSKQLSLPPEVKSRYKMNHPESKKKSREEELQSRISELERSLAYERMRREAYIKLIEITEREEGISILKKDGAKQ